MEIVNKVVAEFDNMINANTALMHLEDNGINGELQDNNTFNLSIMNSSIDPSIKILVKEKDLEKATQIISDIKIKETSVFKDDEESELNDPKHISDISNRESEIELIKSDSKVTLITFICLLALVEILQHTLKSIENSFLVSQVFYIIYTTILVFPILYYSYKRKNFALYGINKIKISVIISGIVLGLVLFPLMIYSGISLMNLLHHFLGDTIIVNGKHQEFLPENRIDLFINIITYLFYSFSHEIVFRKCFITSFQKQFNSNIKAVFLSAILFAVCFWASGLLGVIHSFFFGLILGAIFLTNKKNVWITISISYTIAVIQLLVLASFGK